ncbi:MAG: ubiquitin carboxyl-terminal hydrolase [Verrucomicrobia bacterium]|nr:ubiquitin carboxyl-terminal hydrolase [Verrucomicrobiota bacterium]MBU6446323.1 ubiquitin carboxyl-terminal hydrolase [Verrucomicrobiota bacterium]
MSTLSAALPRVAAQAALAGVAWYCGGAWVGACTFAALQAASFLKRGWRWTPREVAVVQSAAPSIPLAPIQHQGNSCACSAVLWAFANMPGIEEELERAIRRTTGVKHQALEGLRELVGELRLVLTMSGELVNDLRGLAKSLHPTFRDVQNEQIDASELFNIFADAIFDHESSTYRTTFFARSRDETTWGRLELPFTPHTTLSSGLASYLESYGKFQSAPPLLALSLKRYERDGTPQFDPIIPEEKLKLGTTYLMDVHGATYQLVSVCRRQVDAAHYDAVWRNSRGQWYYGDDLKGVKPITAPEALKCAQTGYLFIYLKSS